MHPMQEKFHVSFLKKHIIYPVFFYLITKNKHPRIRTPLMCNARFCFFLSWDPRHARILQAHYNGSKLLIHKTEPYDFIRVMNLKAMSLFARWPSSSGIGNTRS